MKKKEKDGKSFMGKYSNLNLEENWLGFFFFFFFFLKECVTSFDDVS